MVWFTLFTIIGSIVAIAWFIGYVYFHVTTRLAIPRHEKTNEKLNGPSPYFVVGINPISHKPTHLHKRFNDYCNQFGDFFWFSLFFEVGICIGDPEILTELMNNKEFTMRMYPPLFDRYLKNRGILFTNDLPHWKVQRAAALQGIMKTSHLKKIAVWTNNTVDKFLERLDKTYSTNDKFELEIDPEFSKVALDVIGQAAFSIEVNSVVEANSNFTQLVNKVMNMTAKYNYLPPWIYRIYYPSGLKEGEDALIELRNMVRTLLLERRKGGDFTTRNDLLDILLSFQQDGEQEITDEDIILTCWDMFIAGHETTAHSLAWSMYFLSRNLELQEEVFKEIEREIGDNIPDFDNIKNLNLCQNIVKEALRLKPVIPIFTRISPTEQTLAGYKLAPNTPILICNSRLHVHPKYWDNPLKFDPHRWSRMENQELMPYRPFGFGARACVGSRMTFIESKVVLAKFLRTYRVLPHDSKIEEVLQITLAPKGLKLYLQKRK